MDTTVQIKFWWDDARGVRQVIENYGKKLDRPLTTSDMVKIGESMELDVDSEIIDEISRAFESAVLEVLDKDLVDKGGE